MFLYLLYNQGSDTFAAVLLLKEFYVVKPLRSIGSLGILYLCERQIDPDHLNTLGIIEFN